MKIHDPEFTGSIEFQSPVIGAGITSSLFGTASYVTGSIFTSTNPALSASYAVTAAFALNAGASGIGGSGTTNRVAKFTAATTLGNSNIFDDGTNVQITGSTIVISGSSASLVITGSVISSKGFTGSLIGTASYAISSSFAVSSSFAISASHVPGTVTGTGGANRIAFWSNASTLTSDSFLQYSTSPTRVISASNLRIIDSNEASIFRQTNPFNASVGGSDIFFSLEDGYNTNSYHTILSLSYRNTSFGDVIWYLGGSNTMRWTRSATGDHTYILPSMAYNSRYFYIGSPGSGVGVTPQGGGTGIIINTSGDNQQNGSITFLVGKGSTASTSTNESVLVLRKNGDDTNTIIMTGSVIMSGSAGIELSVIGDTQFSGSVNSRGGFTGSIANLSQNLTITGSLIVSGSGGAGVFSKGITLADFTAPFNVTGSYFVWRAPYNATVVALYAIKSGSSNISVNARRSGSGTSLHLASNLTITANNLWTAGGAPQNTTYSAGDSLEIILSGSSVIQTSIQVDFIKR